MKFLVVLLAVASLAHGKVVPDNHTAFGYLKNSIAEAEKIRVREEQYLQQQRDRLVSAAHCWSDGQNQVWRVEVILGSVTLFTGGNRQFTSVFINHPSWFPLLVRNDVGVIYLPTSVTFSSTIAPVPLPQGAELEETFAGESAIASGFGLTVDGGSISSNQFLSQVRLNVLSNSVCRFGFPLILQDSNICTSGIGGVGTCSGDSGGPLYITRGNRNVLMGVTSFMPFINQHL
uniref:Chymotrypsin-like serine protease n=1 Tax=Ostrinia nubilalis TaxID=29057 RepID=Q56IA9_OSTNU|nr:chymotrypsin-like serine protease [Ostrinia nubilalis]